MPAHRGTVAVPPPIRSDMSFEDKLITCEDCGKEFAHTAEDQQRYAERGFTADPKRCRECRQIRKDKSAAGKAHGGPRRGPGGGGGGGRPGGGSRGFQGHHRAGGSGFSSQGGRGGGQGRPQRQSFDAICAACGTPTTVPFEPTQGREVFCRDCFRKMREE